MAPPCKSQDRSGGTEARTKAHGSRKIHLCRPVIILPLTQVTVSVTTPIGELFFAKSLPSLGATHYPYG